MRVVAYIRVSTDEQAGGKETQLNAIKSFCERKGWTLKPDWICVDEDVSRDTDPRTRQGFMRAVELAKSLDRIIVAYALDRVCCGSLLMELSDWLSKEDLVLISVNEEWLTDIALSAPQLYKFILYAIGYGAAMELERIRQRTRDAMERVRDKHLEGIARRCGSPPVAKIPDMIKDLVVKLYQEGRSMGEVAEMLGLSKHKVRRILVERGVIKLDDNVCPRCFHRMELMRELSSPLLKVYRCRYCGYKKEKSIDLTGVAKNNA